MCPQQDMLVEGTVLPCLNSNYNVFDCSDCAVCTGIDADESKLTCQNLVQTICNNCGYSKTRSVQEDYILLEVQNILSVQDGLDKARAWFPEDDVDCECCNGNHSREACKSVTTLPAVLCISLKRGQYGKSDGKSESSSKIQDKVCCFLFQAFEYLPFPVSSDQICKYSEHVCPSTVCRPETRHAYDNWYRHAGQSASVSLLDLVIPRLECLVF